MAGGKTFIEGLFYPYRHYITWALHNGRETEWIRERLVSLPQWEQVPEEFRLTEETLPAAKHFTAYKTTPQYITEREEIRQQQIKDFDLAELTGVGASTRPLAEEVQVAATTQLVAANKFMVSSMVRLDRSERAEWGTKECLSNAEFCRLQTSFGTPGRLVGRRHGDEIRLAIGEQRMAAQAVRDESRLALQREKMQLQHELQLMTAKRVARQHGVQTEEEPELPQEPFTMEDLKHAVVEELGWLPAREYLEEAHRRYAPIHAQNLHKKRPVPRPKLERAANLQEAAALSRFGSLRCAARLAGVQDDEALQSKDRAAYLEIIADMRAPLSVYTTGDEQMATEQGSPFVVLDYDPLSNGPNIVPLQPGVNVIQPDTTQSPEDLMDEAERLERLNFPEVRHTPFPAVSRGFRAVPKETDISQTREGEKGR